MKIKSKIKLNKNGDYPKFINIYLLGTNFLAPLSYWKEL